MIPSALCKAHFDLDLKEPSIKDIFFLRQTGKFEDRVGNRWN